MDDQKQNPSDQQGSSPQSNEPRSGLGGQRVIQPTEAILKEVQSQQQVPAPTPEPSSNTQAPKPNAIYPEAEQGVNTSVSTASLPEAQTNSQRSPKSRKMPRILIVATIIILITVGAIFFGLTLKTHLSSAKDVVTPNGNFSSYTWPTYYTGTQSAYHKSSIYGTVDYLFYKDSAYSGSNNGLLSPSLSGGRLPISIGISAGTVQAAGLSSGQAKKCVVNGNGNSFNFSVYVKATKSTANVCTFQKVAGGGPSIDQANFSDAKNNYSLVISIPHVNSAPSSKYNLNHYTTDIKNIIGSMQPSQ